jgi:hypothetical protein
MKCETCGSQMIVHGDCLDCNRPLSAHGPVPEDLLAPRITREPVTASAAPAEAETVVAYVNTAATPQLVGLT